MFGWPGARRYLLRTRYVAERTNERLRAWLRLGPTTIPLETVQRRLELVLTAMYGRAIPIAAIEKDVWTRERVRQFTQGDIRGADAMPGIDGETIYLPVELHADGDARKAMERYRLFAIEQAERVTRGTAALAPLEDPLERDLYLLREAAAIDAHIAQSHPGVLDALGTERRFVLARRPKMDSLTAAERDVETLLRATLTASPEEMVSPSSSPEESLEWARATAERIRGGGVKYRGLPPATMWGTVRPAENKAGPQREGGANRMSPRAGGDTHARETREGVRSAAPGGGETLPADKFAPPDEGGVPTGVAAGNTSALNRQTQDEELAPPIYYDEWNTATGSYVKAGAAVRLHDSAEGDAAWARETLQSHAAVVRKVRHQFERLRARRTLLSRQRAGDELDITACVNAIIERRRGESPDDRLYLDARPARRGLAISLLVDVSGSTELRVTDDWRIIDLEKIALLLATQALDALGDLYAVYAFAGRSATNVKMTVVKNFNERTGETVHRRIDALEPGGFTRLGTAVRHATRELSRQSAGHRLLLLLSDGRPNDVDLYQGTYGVEDARQAIFEARASGVYPFCLTIDRDASEYLPRIFGQAGHTILQRPEQLPTALLGVVRALIKR